MRVKGNIILCKGWYKVMINVNIVVFCVMVRNVLNVF